MKYRIIDLILVTALAAVAVRSAIHDYTLTLHSRWLDEDYKQIKKLTTEKDILQARWLQLRYDIRSVEDQLRRHEHGNESEDQGGCSCEAAICPAPEPASKAPSGPKEE